MPGPNYLPLNSQGSIILPSEPSSGPLFTSCVKLELGEYILQQNPYLNSKGIKTNELNQILTAIKLAAKVVNRLITKHSSFGLDEKGTKKSNEDVSEIACTADRAFMEAISNRDVVAGLATSLSGDFTSFEKTKEKTLVMLIHPMDGTKQVDVNVSCGSIFSVYKRVSPVGTQVTKEDFLQEGESQVCAGYVLYGSSTVLVCTIGRGVHGFTLDPSIGTFFMSHPNIRIPVKGSIYSVNGGKFNKFPIAVRDYIDYCQEKGFSCRYIGSLVADFHRNMLKGGIYIYPPTFTDPTPSVNMIFQCNPLAFLAEQAGGKASDGFTRIQLIQPISLNDRIPFFCGSSGMVEAIELFMARNKMRDGGWCYRGSC